MHVHIYIYIYIHTYIHMHNDMIPARAPRRRYPPTRPCLPQHVCSPSAGWSPDYTYIYIHRERERERRGIRPAF